MHMLTFDGMCDASLLCYQIMSIYSIFGQETMGVVMQTTGVCILPNTVK